MKVIRCSLNWAKKHFFKKQYNHKNTLKMELVKDDVKKYQWRSGDDFGKIVEVESIDGEFTNFTDGSRIFTNVLPEFLEEIIDGVIPFPGADQLMAGQNGIGFNVTKTQQASVVANVEPKESPLEQLVNKLSKKNVEPFETKINLNIPNKKVFDMLIENADEDREELIKTIAKVAVSQIEIHKLQEYLTEEVSIFINNYYND
jgi:hypothetical protein